jgi:hypothetical protein
MLDIRTYCKRFMLWTAIIVAVVIGILGLCFGKVVEANLAEEIGKWVLMGLFIVGIFEMFAYILSPMFYHHGYMKRRKRDDGAGQE